MNLSDYINDLIRKDKEESGGIEQDLINIDEEEQKLYSKKISKIQALFKKYEDGSKREREEANRLIKEKERVEEEKNKQRIQAFEEFLRAIEIFGYQHEIHNILDYRSLVNLLNKMAKDKFDKDIQDIDLILVMANASFVFLKLKENQKIKMEIKNDG